MGSSLPKGYFAYNTSDVVARGYIDQFVTKTPLNDSETPKGLYELVRLENQRVVLFGKSFPRAKISYTAALNDIGVNDYNEENPTDRYPYKKYNIFVEYGFFNSQGVTVGSFQKVKYVVHIVNDPSRKKTDTLTEKWILNSLSTGSYGETAEFVITPQSPSNLTEQNKISIVDISYDGPYFSSKIIKLLPSSILGLWIKWLFSINLPIIPSTDLSGFRSVLGAGLLDRFVDAQETFNQLLGAKLTRPVIFKWGLQLQDASTIVNKEIVINDIIYASRGSISGQGEMFYVPVVSSTNGINKVLCVTKKKVEFSPDDLRILGKGFDYAGNPLAGIDFEKIEAAEPIDFSIVQNRALKNKYKSGSSQDNAPGLFGSRTDSNNYQINSPLFNFNEDSVCSDVYLMVPADFIQQGDKIYITYGQVRKHHFRQVSQRMQAYYAPSGLSDFRPVYDRSGQYEFKKFKFKVLSSHIEKNIYYKNIVGRNIPASGGGSGNEETSVATPYEDRLLDLSRDANNAIANHSNYLEDISNSELPLPSRPPKILEDFNCYRITKAKSSPAFYVKFFPPNGYFVGRSIGIRANGVDYPPGIYHIDANANPKLILRGDQVRNQDWWHSSFDSKGVHNVDLFYERSQIEFYFDTNGYVNSYIIDDKKIGYEIEFAIALNGLKSKSRFIPSSPNSGVGICCLDLIDVREISPRVSGIDLFYNDNQPARYIDASESVFDLAKTTDKVWGFNVVQAMPQINNSPSQFNVELSYSFYDPVDLAKNGRIFWENIGPGNQSVLSIYVVTKTTSDFISGHFDTSKMEKGSIIFSSDKDDSIRINLIESQISEKYKGSALKIRSQFPDQSYMDRDIYTSSINNITNYKWLPIDSVPFYVQGRKIFVSYQTNNKAQHTFVSTKRDNLSALSVFKKQQDYSFEYINPSSAREVKVTNVEISFNSSEKILINVSGTIKVEENLSNVDIRFIHCYSEDGEEKILFIPILKYSNNAGSYIQFSFYANFMKNSFRLVIPYDLEISISNISLEVEYIDESNTTKYREYFLNSDSYDIIHSKDNIKYLVFSDVVDETLDVCVIKNDNSYSRIIRTIYQTLDDEKVSNIICRSSPESDISIVMYQINSYILGKVISIDDLQYIKYDLMSSVNSLSFAFASVSAGSNFNIISLNPEYYSQLQNSLSDLGVSKQEYQNKIRIKPAFFVHGNFNETFSKNIFIEASIENDIVNRRNSSRVNLFPGQTTQCTIEYADTQKDLVYYPRVKDFGSSGSFNVLSNTQKFSFEICDDGLILLFLIKDGNMFIKRGGVSAAFIDIFYKTNKIKDSLYNDFGMIALRPIKYLVSTIGSYYSKDDNGEVSSVEISNAPEIDSISTVYVTYAHTLYIFYVIENNIFYQYFVNFPWNDGSFINHMFTDNINCNSKSKITDYQNSLNDYEFLNYSCKSLPVFLCGSLNEELKAAMKQDLDNKIYGYSNFKNRKSYIINPYSDYDFANIDFKIEGIAPKAIVQRNGIVRVYVKDENGYLRGFSINEYNVTPDTYVAQI